jgi:hypothetical protein
MKKITLGYLISRQDSIKKLINVDLSIDKAFKLKKMFKKITEEMETIHEVRNSVIKRLSGGTVDAKGSPYIPAIDEEECEKYNWTVEKSKKAHKEFEDEINKLYSQETDITFIKLSLEDLKHAKLSTKDVMNLEEFIEDNGN